MLGHHQILINRRCISLGYEPCIVLLQQQSHIIYTYTIHSVLKEVKLCCNQTRVVPNANIGAQKSEEINFL